jgi:ABC-type Zn2+ transport system substrate-binding protein/surface adhesin
MVVDDDDDDDHDNAHKDDDDDDDNHNNNNNYNQQHDTAGYVIGRLLTIATTATATTRKSKHNAQAYSMTLPEFNNLCFSALRFF